MGSTPSLTLLVHVFSDSQGNTFEKMCYSFLCVTVPTAIFRKAAYIFFVTPCLIYDGSKTSRTLDSWLDRCGSFFAVIGYLVTAAWAAYLFYFGLNYWRNEQSTAQDILYLLFSIVQFWVFWFVFILVFDFNPWYKAPRYFSWLNTIVHYSTCGIIKVRVGRWHLERDFVHGIIRRAIKDRGVEHFHLPEQHAALSGDGKFEVSVGISVPDVDNEDCDSHLKKFTLDDVFDLLDSNGDGMLSKAEVISKHGKLQMTKDQADALFDELDTDHDGFVSRDEFVQSDLSSRAFSALGDVGTALFDFADSINPFRGGESMDVFAPTKGSRI
jgi:hypothetical protein